MFGCSIFWLVHLGDLLVMEWIFGPNCPGFIPFSHLWYWILISSLTILGAKRAGSLVQWTNQWYYCWPARYPWCEESYMATAELPVGEIMLLRILRLWTSYISSAMIVANKETLLWTRHNVCSFLLFHCTVVLVSV